MKTLSATKASKEFGRYLDMAQREPILITKKNRPVAITMSIQDAEKLLEYRIQNGINRGMEDVKAGRTFEATTENIASMKARIRIRT